MKYFVIYPDQEPLKLEEFNKNNQHLSMPVTSIKAPVSNPDLREQLLKEKIITPDNLYNSINLAFAQAHILLWKQAVETQSSITVFESNTITHKNFLTHQKQSLSLKNDYDLMILGYNLNWNPCLELMPCLPRVIYTFCGYDEIEIKQENNSIINIATYQDNDLTAIQTLKTFSFSGLGCYTISAKGAEKLLQRIKQIDNTSTPSYQEVPYGTNFYVFRPLKERENISFDIEVNRHIEDLNTYMTIPMLAVIPTDTSSQT